MTSPRRPDPADLDRAIEWRERALIRMGDAQERLEGLLAGMPGVTEERLLVERALRQLRAAQNRCSDNVRAGRRMRDEA